jgi:hypothetical protein
MELSTLDKHIGATYFYLRTGLAVLALLFPFILVLVGWLVYSIELQDSMSAYYFAFAPQGSALRVFPMRGWFVGILWAIGAFLILYRGYSTGEDRVLNLAGLSALGVAMLPMAPPPYCANCGTGWPFLHHAFAVLLFVCIAVVAWVFRWETVQLLRDKRLRDRFGRVYSGLAMAMVLSPLLAVAVSFGVNAYKAYILFIEIFGIVVFAVFWLTKTYEFRLIEAQLALRDARHETLAGRLTEEERASLSMRLNKSLGGGE